MNWMGAIYAAMVLFVLIARFLNKKDRMRFAIAEALGLVVLGVMISEVLPPDLRVYMNAFVYLRNVSFGSVLAYGWEIGYVMLNKLIGTVVKDPFVFKVVISLLTMIPVLYRIIKDSEFPQLSLLIYVTMGTWMASLGLYRQYLAISVLTLSYPLIVQRKLIPAMVVFAIAFLFHRTAIVFFPVYFLYKYEITFKTICIFSAIGILFLFLGGRVLAFLNRYARMQYSAEVNGGIAMLGVLMLSVAISYCTLRKGINSNPTMKLYFLMLLCAMSLQMFTQTFSMASRLVQYFSISLSTILPFVYIKIVPIRKNGALVLITDLILIGCLVFWFTANGEVLFYFLER